MADPPIVPAPVPPSVDGIAQPVFASGDATDPAADTLFPEFTPIVPPPLIGEGGGPAPDMPPPLTELPEGVLVGPVVAPAAVPPSVAGFPRIRFASGGVNVPPNTFPKFTTNPPYPPAPEDADTQPPPSTPPEPPIDQIFGIIPPPVTPLAAENGETQPPSEGRRRRRKPV